ncbi:MAG: VCBS repeat-containing protein [Pseudomonadota bacterium]
MLNRLPWHLAVLCLFATASIVARSEPDWVTPEFRVQTDMLEVQFSDSAGSALAFAGRNERGQPRLGLIRVNGDSVTFREMELPNSAIAIDKATVGRDVEGLFVLTSDNVQALQNFDGELAVVATSKSLFRGRSLAELTSGLDFARDIDADNQAEFVVPDFDVMHVIDDAERREVALASFRRTYDQSTTYRPPNITAAAAIGGGTLYSVRGSELLSVPPNATEPRSSDLDLGLSDELALERYYNSYEDIDQNDIVLREMDRFVDINGDDVPDIMTLETVSQGVFDKTTTYRVHHGSVDSDALIFAASADTTLSSRGYQIGMRLEPLDDDRKMLVVASVQVGVRAIIGALFSRSVTMRVDIHTSDQSGTINSEPTTEIKSRVKFDFGTGQVEFPTIAFGDLDGDGTNDLILKERKRALSWRQGVPGGGFENRSSKLAITGPADGTQVALADLNGDSRDEVVIRFGRADGESLAGKIAVHRDFELPD